MSASQLAEIRRLLERAFPDDFTEDDWDHTQGGWHITAREGGAAVAYVAVVARAIDVGATRYRTGYVEAVATDPPAQGRGLGSAVMRAAADIIREHFEMGALATDLHRFYERLGWVRWQGPTFVRTADDLVRSDDAIMALMFGPSADLDVSARITCEGRQGDDW